LLYFLLCSSPLVEPKELSYPGSLKYGLDTKTYKTDNNNNKNTSKQEIGEKLRPAGSSNALDSSFHLQHPNKKKKQKKKKEKKEKLIKEL
jgi:hypothetical protein